MRYNREVESFFNGFMHQIRFVYHVFKFEMILCHPVKQLYVLRFYFDQQHVYDSGEDVLDVF